MKVKGHGGSALGRVANRHRVAYPREASPLHCSANNKHASRRLPRSPREVKGQIRCQADESTVATMAKTQGAEAAFMGYCHESDFLFRPFRTSLGSPF